MSVCANVCNVIGLETQQVILNLAQAASMVSHVLAFMNGHSQHGVVVQQDVAAVHVQTRHVALLQVVEHFEQFSV